MAIEKVVETFVHLHYIKSSGYIKSRGYIFRNFLSMVLNSGKREQITSYPFLACGFNGLF